MRCVVKAPVECECLNCSVFQPGSVSTFTVLAKGSQGSKAHNGTRGYRQVYRDEQWEDRYHLYWKQKALNVETVTKSLMSNIGEMILWVLQFFANIVTPPLTFVTLNCATTNLMVLYWGFRSHNKWRIIVKLNNVLNWIVLCSKNRWSWHHYKPIQIRSST